MTTQLFARLGLSKYWLQPDPQWINCDIRTMDMELLGQFSVIMADPPWDIHIKFHYLQMYSP